MVSAGGQVGPAAHESADVTVVCSKKHQPYGETMFARPLFSSKSARAAYLGRTMVNPFPH
jgi:hypothetical protein